MQLFSKFKQMSDFQRKLTSFLAAMCIFLSAVEFAIPKPLPFLRIGLANLPVILALSFFNFPQLLKLVLIKVLVQGIISGTLFSYVFLFSCAGSFSSAITMYLLYKFFFNRGWVSALGLTLAGSMANNCAQILMARLILFGENTKYVAPLLLLTGLISGLILGIFVELFEKKSSWYGDRLKEFAGEENV